MADPILPQKLAKLQTNMDRLDSIVNGNDSSTVTVDSAIVPTIAKFLKDQQERITTLFNDTWHSAFDYLLNQVSIEVARAEIAADRAQDIVNDSGIIRYGSIPIYSCVVNASSYTIPVDMNYVRVNGYYSAGDGGGGDYRKVDTEPTHPAKFQSGDGAWWELCSPEPSAEMFGLSSKKPGSVNSPALENASLYGEMFGVPIKIGAGLFEIDQPIILRSNTGFVGIGSKLSKFILAANADCNMVETKDVRSFLGTKNSSAPSNFIFKSIGLNGNRLFNYGGMASAVNEGYGVLIYGHNYTLHDLVIVEMAGIGIYSEFAPSEVHDVETTMIEKLRINFTSREAFYFVGPSDPFIDNVVCGMIGIASRTGNEATTLKSLVNPGKDIDGFVIERNDNSSGTCELGFIHSYNNKEGYCMRITGASSWIRVSGQTVHAEGGRGNLLIEGGCVIGLSNVFSRNNSYSLGGIGRPDVTFSTTGSRVHVDSLTIYRSPSSANSDAVLFNNSVNTFIGSLYIDGVERAGHGVVVAGEVRDSGVGNTMITRLKGIAADGEKSSAFCFRSGYQRFSIGDFKSIYNDMFWTFSSSPNSVITTGSSGYVHCLAGQELFRNITKPNENYWRGSNITFNVNGTIKSNISKKTASISLATTGLQTVEIEHNFYRKPEVNECFLSPYWGSSIVALPMVAVKSITETSITLVARIDTTLAGNMIVGVTIQ